MNKYQTLLPLKGFYYSFLAFVLLLSSCDKEMKTNDGNESNQVVTKNSDELGYTKIPKFEGTWVSESDPEDTLYIKMVHEKLYQVKGRYYYNRAHSLSPDFTYISREFTDYRGEGLHYSKDGRLFYYENNEFFKRVE